MISIITAIHNGLAVNRLFLKSLKKNTRMPYELIIVDNHSTDGSAELFEEAGATVIRNPENHCYPESQNMGMEKATGDYFAFL
ncbi:MAG: glycosyltransferase, partial [Bacteroidetes bacterium]